MTKQIAAPSVPKRIAVDFDGTLCDMVFPEIGAIKKDAREALTLFKTLGFKIIIWSCRTCHWDYDIYGGDRNQPTLERDRVKAMAEWLDANGIPYDEIDDGSKGKPGADYTWTTKDQIQRQLGRDYDVHLRPREGLETHSRADHRPQRDRRSKR